MGVHLLRCVHGIECIKTHDVIRDTFVTIVRDVGFHMGRKQITCTSFNHIHSFCWWVDIVFTKDGIRTLADVVIVDPTWAYLFP